MTYFSEKVVKEDLPEDALLLTRMDVQRILRISRSVFDSIKRAGGWDSATVAFGRAFRYRREFIEKVARGEVVLPTTPAPSRQGSKTWQQQLADPIVAPDRRSQVHRLRASQGRDAACQRRYQVLFRTPLVQSLSNDTQ